MRYRIILLALFSFIFVACKKTINVNVLDSPDTGSFNYKVVDDAGLGLPGAVVSVYKRDPGLNYIYINPALLVDKQKTDGNGLVSFAGLLPDNYLIVTDSAVVNRITYNMSEYVQVVSGIVKEKQVKASEFSGSLRITFKSNLDYQTPLDNMNIAALTVNPNTMTTEERKEAVNNAPVKGVTNAQGVVTLKIPSGVRYYIMAYTADKGMMAYWYDVYLVEKNATYVASLYTSPFYQ